MAVVELVTVYAKMKLFVAPNLVSVELAISIVLESIATLLMMLTNQLSRGLHCPILFSQSLVSAVV